MAVTGKRQIEAEKHFKQQDSLLTTLISGNHQIRSLYNIILAFVVVFTLTTIGDYMSNPERYKRDYSIVSWNLQYFYPHFVLPWTLMNCSLLFLLYPLVCFRYYLQWRQVHSFVFSEAFLKNSSNAKNQELEDGVSQLNKWTCLVLNVVYVAIMASGVVGFTSWYILSQGVSISISFALTMEMARLLMKGQSYFVEKSVLVVSKEEIEKLLANKSHHTVLSLTVRGRPRFQALLYFLFAPTLIYRDAYPRTDRIRWSLVLTHSLQMLLCILTAAVAINRFLVDNLEATGKERFVMANLSRQIGSLFLFGAILLLVCFWGLQHCWHNLTAELLKYGDRKYYDAWWEAVSPNEYYRKWNLLVQEWLYTYIYVPVYNRTNSRNWAIYAVILLSGIAHEYIIFLSIKFFFPVLIVAFCFGGHLYFMAFQNRKYSGMQANVHNAFFLLSNFLGWGLLSSAYSLEWYSRNNCPLQNSTFTDQITPRLFSCIKLR